MIIRFCFFGIVPNSAVERAWLRLQGLFIDAGFNTDRFLNERVSIESLIKNRRNFCKGDILVCANMWQVFLLRIIFLGRGLRIIYWVQGLVAEESYLRNKSAVRYIVLRMLECLALYLSEYFIYVSPYMRDFFELRFKFLAKRNHVIVPCISDLRLRNLPHRDPGSYCYLGGMAKWQRFDLIVKIMNVVVREDPSATFRVATKDVSICREILDMEASEELCRVTSICSLSTKDEVEDFLSRCQFGLLIRDDVPINNVSSPIKLAEYLSCGVFVITSLAIKSYASILGGGGAVIDSDYVIQNDSWTRPIYPGEDVVCDIFRNNFSSESVTSRISGFVKEIRW